MVFFDTHLHLPKEEFDATCFYNRAAESQVKYLMACSSGIQDTMNSARFAETIHNAWFTAGVHPHEAESEKAPISDYAACAERTRFAAVGEIGLDYFYEISSKHAQQTVFEQFLSLALELHVPAIVHCRDKEQITDAYQDAYALLKDFSKAGGSFVLHSFAGTLEWMERFRSLGAWFGVGGMLTFKRAENIRAIVAHIPMERILLETDSPYLAPVPFRGKTNHPALLPYTAEVLADLLKIPIQDCARITTENAFRFLNMGEPE